MSREERKLRKHLDEHTRREQRKANKHLSKLRAGEPKPPRERMDVRAVDHEEVHPPPVKKRTRNESGVPASAGFVAEIGPGFCDILSAGERVRCRSSGDLAVGDQVLFSPARRRIEEVLPRRTVLSRTDPHNPRLERVIAANIDVVVNVVSLKTPPLRPGLIDRYLIAIGKSGAEPLLCVNKIDLLASPQELEPLRPYQDVGIAVVFCSAVPGRRARSVVGSAGREAVRVRRPQRRWKIFAAQRARSAARYHHRIRQLGQRKRPPHHHVLGALPSAQRRHCHRHAGHSRVRALGCQSGRRAPLLSRVRRLPLRLLRLHPHARAGLRRQSSAGIGRDFGSSLRGVPADSSDAGTRPVTWSRAMPCYAKLVFQWLGSLAINPP